MKETGSFYCEEVAVVFCQVSPYKLQLCVCVCVCRLADLLSDCVEAQGHLDSLSTQVRSHLYLSQSLDPVLMETGRRG